MKYWHLVFHAALTKDFTEPLDIGHNSAEYWLSLAGVSAGAFALVAHAAAFSGFLWPASARLFLHLSFRHFNFAVEAALLILLNSVRL